MDDEPDSDVVSHAVERLRASGYQVDMIETLGEAVAACYRCDYRVFVLDIDMSHQAIDEEGDGVQMLKRLMALHNQTRVILFSGAGTVNHWFQAANAHCHAYIHKLDRDPDSGADSVERLLHAVREAMDAPPRPSSLTPGAPPARLLLVGEDAALNVRARQIAGEALGDGWMIDERSLSADLELASDGYGLVLILQPQFQLRARVREALARLLALAPRPQCIVGCEGRDELRPSILALANRHPFRLIDLLQPNWEHEVRAALLAGLQWYGQTEIQTADPEHLPRSRILLAEDLDLERLEELEALETGCLPDEAPQSPASSQSG